MRLVVDYVLRFFTVIERFQLFADFVSDLQLNYPVESQIEHSVHQVLGTIRSVGMPNTLLLVLQTVLAASPVLRIHRDGGEPSPLLIVKPFVVLLITVAVLDLLLVNEILNLFEILALHTLNEMSTWTRVELDDALSHCIVQ